MLILSCLASSASTDSLLCEINPSLTQRGVRVADWRETDKFINDGKLKYQVIFDTKKQENFAILNQVDTALRGKVVIPQFIHSDEGEELEVRGLGLYAFYLGKVSEVKLPESVEYIGDCAFFRCYGIQKLNIPEKVHTIGNWALMYSALDSIRFPDNLVNLGALCVRWAIDSPNFYRNVKYIYLGKNVTDIRINLSQTFSKKEIYGYPYISGVFHALEKIEVSPDNPVYYCDDGVLYDKKYNAFCLYPASKKDAIYLMPDDIRSIYHVGAGAPDYQYSPSSINMNSYVQVVKFSEGLDSITNGALHWCENLKTIILPANLKYITQFVSSGCHSVKSVYAQNPVPSEVGEDLLEGMERGTLKSATLYVPKGCVEAYRAYPVWANTFKEVKEYDSIDYSISDLSFCKELTATGDKAVFKGNYVKIITDDHQSTAYIYDMQGRIVASGREREFFLKNKGVFLLKFKGLSQKFVVR